VKVTHNGGYDLKSGGHVDYYDVGSWSMELISGELDKEISDARNAVKAYKAWYRWLKKQRRKQK